MGFFKDSKICPECGGTGYGLDGGQCENCYGEGIVEEE